MERIETKIGIIREKLNEQKNSFNHFMEVVTKATDEMKRTIKSLEEETPIEREAALEIITDPEYLDELKQEIRKGVDGDVSDLVVDLVIDGVISGLEKEGFVTE